MNVASYLTKKMTPLEQEREGILLCIIHCMPRYMSMLEKMCNLQKELVEGDWRRFGGCLENVRGSLTGGQEGGWKRTGITSIIEDVANPQNITWNILGPIYLQHKNK